MSLQALLNAVKKKMNPARKSTSEAKNKDLEKNNFLKTNQIIKKIRFMNLFQTFDLKSKKTTLPNNNRELKKTTLPNNNWELKKQPYPTATEN